jgi:MFS family permease
VYLVEVLEADASVYGLEGAIYAFGAIIAGLLVPNIARKLGNEKIIIFGVVTYTIAISLIIFVQLPAYLTLMFFLALGNSGARVARNSFLMDEIPNEIIGRVDSLFRSIGLLFRIVLLGIFTGMVSSNLIIYCFVVLSGLLLLSSVLVIFSWKKGFLLKQKDCNQTLLSLNKS